MIGQKILIVWRLRNVQTQGRNCKRGSNCFCWKAPTFFFLSFGLYFFLSFFLLCLYIVWATLALLLLPVPGSRLNLFCSLVLWFCWRDNIGNNKDIAFLLVWDEDSYTERFLALLPCTCVLQSTGSSLSDLFATSSSPSHSGLCQFVITLFAPLPWAHQPHSGFKFPSLSVFFPCVFSP
jgi:hypothetical protein